MRFTTGALLILSIVCCHEIAVTASSIVTNKVVEYSQVACPPWVTILYTMTTRSKVACVALGLQTILCETIQYNPQNNQCFLITDRISSNMNFVSNPNLIIINLNRNPCIGIQTITFDDIPNISPIENAISSSYACFNWINGWYINATTNTTINTGYQTVLTSGQYVALNRNGTTLNMSLANGSFNIISFWASAAYTNNSQITIHGLRNNAINYTRTVTLNTSTRFLVQLNWTSIDKITIDSQPYGIDYQFAMDNLVVVFL